MSLNDILTTLGISPPGPLSAEPGQLLSLAIIPSLAGVKISDVLDKPVDLKIIWKGVLFNNTDLDDATIDGPLKAFNLTSIPPTVMTGVPGNLGAITGTIPIPVEVPVRVDIQWSVVDEAGTILVPGADYLAPNGLTSPEAAFIFLPQIVELSDSVLPEATLFIRASVRLTAGTTQTPWQDLPNVPVTIPAIPIPTVLTFFRDRDMKGAALVVVPGDSLIQGLEHLNTVISTVQSKISLLTSVASFAAFALGLQELTNALQSQPNVVFRKADRINNFNDIDLIKRPWYRNDIEAEDELSSLIFVGSRRKQAECFNDRGCDQGEGKFTLTTGPKLLVTIRNLHSKRPTSGPDGNEITIDMLPPDGLFSADSFGDELSSMRFVEEPIP
jgi:hypothetical protein